MFYEQFLLFCSVLQSKNVYKNEALLYFQPMEWYIFSKCFLEDQTSSLQLELNLTHLQ